jgi:hypothetical protein
MAPPFVPPTRPFSTCHNYHLRCDKPTFSPIYLTALSYPLNSFVTMATKPDSPNTVLPSGKTTPLCSEALATQTGSGIYTSRNSPPLLLLPSHPVTRPTTYTNYKTYRTSYNTCIQHAAVQSPRYGLKQLTRGISPCGPPSPLTWSKSICQRPLQPPKATNKASPKASDQPRLNNTLFPPTRTTHASHCQTPNCWNQLGVYEANQNNRTNLQ